MNRTSLERSSALHHLYEFNPRFCSGKYQFPVIRKEMFIPKGVMAFNHALQSKNYDAFVHFYCDDYKFERIWRQPAKYLKILQRFAGAFSPDFSLYRDMPLAMKIWNTYRSRLIGQMMQNVGIPVIPTVSWAGPETYDFCFDGISPGGAVTVGNIGAGKSKSAQYNFQLGLRAMIATIRPSLIIFYGRKPNIYFEEIKTCYCENTTYAWKKAESAISYINGAD